MLGQGRVVREVKHDTRDRLRADPLGVPLPELHVFFFWFERSVRPSGPTLAFVRPAEFMGGTVDVAKRRQPWCDVQPRLSSDELNRATPARRV